MFCNWTNKVNHPICVLCVANKSYHTLQRPTSLPQNLEQYYCHKSTLIICFRTIQCVAFPIFLLVWYWEPQHDVNAAKWITTLIMYSSNNQHLLNQDLLSPDFLWNQEEHSNRSIKVRTHLNAIQNNSSRIFLFCGEYEYASYICANVEIFGGQTK